MRSDRISLLNRPVLRSSGSTAEGGVSGKASRIKRIPTLIKLQRTTGTRLWGRDEDKE
jgi:hypothetical protein